MIQSPTLRTAPIALTLLGLAVCAAPAVAQTEGAAPAPDDLAGSWTGTYQTPQSGGEVELVFERVDDGWRLMVATTSAEYPVPDPDPAAELTVDGGLVSFVLYWGNLRVDWRGERDGDVITGSLATDHFSGVWEVARNVDRPSEARPGP